MFRSRFPLCDYMFSLMKGAFEVPPTSAMYGYGQDMVVFRRAKTLLSGHVLFLASTGGGSASDITFPSQVKVIDWVLVGVVVGIGRASFNRVRADEPA
jgi:hypothetical protein